MNHSLFKRSFVIWTIILFILASIMPSTISITSDKKNSLNCEGTFNGHLLYTPEYSRITYLINNIGEIVDSWESNYIQGLAVYLLENGNLLRSDSPFFNPTFLTGGVTGQVEIFDWTGTLLWKFVYSNSQHCLHHDIEPLPNGNILMVAMEYKTRDEIIAAGRNPNSLLAGNLWPDHIIEVKPTGPTSGDIVWEWYVWDHLIQDYDSSKNNYGVVEDHPELIDINSGKVHVDFNHINSIDYNEELDQILLSSRNQNEIWIIDHSTTTEEAAGHTGGNSGKGGDILYRWGNPQTYRAGSPADQKLFWQHDARWIESGYPGEGNILIFNNGWGRGYSSVDEIIPPVDSNGNYYLAPDSAYGPEEQTWIYMTENPYDFYAYHLSGAQRLNNGNTLICDGIHGIFFEVTPEKTTIWEYVNPYPNLLQNDVFKIQYYPPEEPPHGPDLDCEGSISWTKVKTGETVNSNFKVKNIGTSGSFLDWEIESYPDWGNWTFTSSNGYDLLPNNPISIGVTVIAPDEENKTFTGEIKIVNIENPDDYCIIDISLATPVSQKVINPLIQMLLERFPNAFPIIRQILGL